MGLVSSLSIEIEGTEIKDFLSVNIDQKMHDLQEFTVLFRMDTFEKTGDSVLNTSKNYIGSTIIIKIESYTDGWQNTKPGLLFKGIIHSVKAVKTETDKEDLVVLKGYSPEYLLSNHPGCRSFTNKSLKQIVETVLKPYVKDVLARNVNPSYSEPIPYCVKYNESNLDFLKRLAARYGEWMYYNGKEFIFGNASGNNENLILNQDLKNLDFSINLKASGFKYISYDYLKAEPFETESGKNMGKMQLNEVGQIAHDTSWKKMGQIDSQFFPHLNVPTGNETKAQNTSVETLASASAMDMCGISGVSENLFLVPGTKITIKEPKPGGNGEIDYGEYIVTSVKHNCNNLLVYENSFTAIPSDAKIPAYANPEAVPNSEPQSALVMDNNDPDKLGRIKVHFFWQEEGQTTDWIRIVSPYSGGSRGFFFIPEIDDEVLVGFEAGNAERPYVMGSLYNGSKKPNDAWPNSKNSFKGLVTNSGMRLEFDEDKKITTIDTPGGNKIILDEDGQSILIEDQSSNKVELTTSGIDLKSPGDINIKADGKITIDGMNGIDITTSAGDINTSGLNINHTADVGFKAKGSATAEVSGAAATFKGDASATIDGGAATTIKGIIVKIN